MIVDYLLILLILLYLLYPTSYQMVFVHLILILKDLPKSISMELDENGELINYNLVNSCITSRKKMAYSKVNKLLDDGEIDEDYLPYTDNLKLMKELSDKLTSIRERRRYANF